MSNCFINGQIIYCPFISRFNFIRSYKKIKKLHERSLRLCQNDYASSYVELLGKQGLVNIHIRNIQQPMVEIFKCQKGLSTPVMNEIVMLRNISYAKKNRTDLDS